MYTSLEVLYVLVNRSIGTVKIEQKIKMKIIDLPNESKVSLVQFSKTRSSEPSFEQAELLDILEKYEQFKMQTLQGEHGKTAQYYMLYVKFIDYYLLLNTSIRTSNFEMYKIALSKIINLYFAFNQPNYARYTVKLN